MQELAPDLKLCSFNPALNLLPKQSKDSLIDVFNRLTTRESVSNIISSVETPTSTQLEIEDLTVLQIDAVNSDNDSLSPPATSIVLHDGIDSDVLSTPLRNGPEISSDTRESPIVEEISELGISGS